MRDKKEIERGNICIKMIRLKRKNICPRVEIREEEARCMWKRRHDNARRYLRRLKLKP